MLLLSNGLHLLTHPQDAAIRLETEEQECRNCRLLTGECPGGFFRHFRINRTPSQLDLICHVFFRLSKARRLLFSLRELKDGLCAWSLSDVDP